MRITLHIGAWKTGSTAIQGFLTANREVLKCNGVFVPDSMERDQRTAARKNLQSGSPDLVDAVINEYRTMVRGHEDTANIVVSSEHYWPLPAADIALLGDALSALTDDVQIVLYARPQDDMWNSLYSQQAKSFRVGPEVPYWGTADFVSHQRSMTLRCTIIAVLTSTQNALAAMPSMRAPYIRSLLRDGDVALDFMDHLGVSDSDLQSPRATSNPSLGWKGVAFSLWVYEHLQVRNRSAHDFSMIRSAFRSVTRKLQVQFDDQAWMGKAPNIMSLAQRKEIRDHYAADNQKLFDRFFEGEDVFGPVKDKPVDSIRYGNIPADEFDLAKRKMLNVLRKRGFDISDVKSILLPDVPKKPKGLKGALGALFSRAS